MKIKGTFILVISFSLLACVSAQRRITKEREKNPRYQYNVGVFHLNNGQVDQALIYLNKALKLNPRFDLALNSMGLAYSMKGEFEKSVEYFLKCLEVNPKLTDTHNHLGTVYQEMGFLEKAEEEFQKAIADEKYHSRELPYFNLARLYYIQNKPEQALDLLENALALNSRFVMAYNLKGLIAEHFNKYDEAIACYSRALKIAPSDTTLHFNLAAAYFKNGEYSKAQELFENLQAQEISSEMKADIAKYLKTIKQKTPLSD